MNETTAARRGEFELGKYRIRFAPLRESPQTPEGMWTRYEIWLGLKFLRVQISYPSQDDCFNAHLDLQRREKEDMRPQTDAGIRLKLKPRLYA